jgi:hypothetical protein
MELDSDFKPLESVVLPNLGELNCSGLILVVGPNSSGKSQFLQDIYQRLSGEPRKLVVATEIKVGRPAEYSSFMEQLAKEGYFEEFIDDNGTKHLKPLTTYLGSGQAIGQIQQSQAQSWHSSYEPTLSTPAKRRSEFLNYFGRLFVTGLFLERRLIAIQQVGLIDFETQSPQHELHSLYLDDIARQSLFDELIESFGKAVWPDCSRGNALCLRVSDMGILPTPEERLSPKVMSTYRQIETEGDGLKSYVATCIALLLGRRPVCLIDEPEMCLHPPQAYNLGRFIGKHGVASKSVTFVSTHSSQILRGVIQTAKEIQIVRMSRRGGQFRAHLVPAEVLSEALTKPTVRAESVLDGIFAQSVIVVESDGDRLVYQTVLETLSTELHLDAHIATVGGVGGIADTCKLYKALKIPVAVIADLDMITDTKRLRRILDILTSNDVADSLTERTQSILDIIKKLPSPIEPQSLRQNIREIVGDDTNWKVGNDAKLRKVFAGIAQALDKPGRIKRGGLSEFPTVPLGELLDDFAKNGLFLVPVGELEGWLSGAKITESKEVKWAWANAAAIEIQKRGSQNGDIWDFVRNVGSFLTKPIESM